MITNEEILREINALPLKAQREVEDFVAFLREHYKGAPAAPVSNLATKAFVGMWRDREDMRDSSAWVRNIRETHWSK